MELIRCIALDVDGVLTDGGIIYDNTGNEIKRFDVKDGLIVSYLQRVGIKVGVITGRSSPLVAKRCTELKMDFQAHGVSRKVDEYNRFKAETGLQDEEIAYIGDDINDLPVLSLCGLSACPSDARAYIRQHVDLVLPSRGGYGVLRDLADMLLEAQGKLSNLLAELMGGKNE